MNLLDKIRKIEKYREEFSRMCREEWLKSLKFVDNGGRILSPDEARSSRPLKMFLEVSEEEASRLGAIVHGKFDRAVNSSEFGVNRTDFRSYRNWAVNPPDKVFGKYHGLTKRAKRLAVWSENLVKDEVLKKLEFYKLISPHTFCFAPRSEGNELERFANELLLKSENYSVVSGPQWVSTQQGQIYSKASHRIGLKGYLHKTIPMFKLKFYSEHQVEGERDLLDVEALFIEREFRGIVHYHVEKPNSKKIAYGPSSKTPDHFEFSRSARNGDIYLKRRNAYGEEVRSLSDVESFNKAVKATSLWDTHPIVAGGELFEQVFRIVVGNPKYQALQHDAIRKYQVVN